MARSYFLWVTKLGEFSLRRAALRLFKVEYDINGLFLAEGEFLPLYRFSTEQASLRALGGNCILS